MQEEVPDEPPSVAAHGPHAALPPVRGDGCAGWYSVTSPTAEAPADDDAQATTTQDNSSTTGTTPWSGRAVQRKGTQPSGVSAPGATGDLNNPAQQGSGNQGGPTAATPNPSGTSAPSASTTAAPGGVTVGASGPGQAATTSPGNPQAGAAGSPSTGPGGTRTGSTTASSTPGDTGSGTSLFDPSQLAALAPPLLEAGASALEMLPMLAAALGGSGDGTSGTSESPQLQNALNILGQLQNAYGDGGSGTGDTGTGTGGTGTAGTTTGSGTGSGSAADALKAHEIYEENVAAAFNGIDNTLANLVTSFAGGHSVNQSQLDSLLQAVDAALAHVGSAALLTSAGEQQVTKILTIALDQAEKLAGNTTTSAQTTATDINELANQYLLILSGEDPNATVSVPGTTSVGGTVGQWISEAAQVLQKYGITLTAADERDLDIIIEHESGGNPDSINETDSNAAAGDPSRGLMQTIGSTFSEYAVPGYNSNIYDPVSNIIAGARYAIARYGSLSNVPGVIAVNEGESYVGY